MESLMLVLPFPPSVNHYWCWVPARLGGGMRVGARGKAFRREVIAIAHGQRARPFGGALAVTIDAFPPDRRRRDGDNLLKATLDALEAAHVFHDDAQVKRLTVQMREPSPPGRIEVHIAPLMESSPAEGTHLP